MNMENQAADSTSEYQEVKIGNTLYRVTSVYLGKIDLGQALEDLTVRKILQSQNDSMLCEC